jgi:hypothetical protein
LLEPGFEDVAGDIGAPCIELDPSHLQAIPGFFHAGLSVSEPLLQRKIVCAKELHFVLRRLAVLTRVNVVNLRYLISSVARPQQARLAQSLGQTYAALNLLIFDLRTLSTSVAGRGGEDQVLEKRRSSLLPSLAHGTYLGLTTSPLLG